MATEQTFNNAHNAVAAALANGELLRGPCELEGAGCYGAVLAHHDDYAKPLDVRWLCRRHHGHWHHLNGPGLNRYDPVRCYCECEFPVIDVEHDAACRRCGLPVDFTPAEPNVGSLAVRPGESSEDWNERRRRIADGLDRRASDRGRDRRAGLELDVDETLLVRRELLERARRQEFVDRVELPRSPVWDEAGSVELRVGLVLAGVVAIAAAVWLLWPYIVGGAVAVIGWRVVTRHTRRRRPRSSWSSLGRTAAMMYAAWNSRWLKGSTLRASIPARAGRGHACDECGRAHDVAPTPASSSSSSFGEIPF
jgi:hypothetical protein